MIQNASDKIIKQNLDLLLLSMLNEKATHGYDLISEFHNEFKILLSPGTLYPVLYHLEKMGFLKVEIIGKTKKYSVTSLGKKKLEMENTVFHRTNFGIDQYLNRKDN